ncbi:hypothetical protein DUNSADRAFT_7638 [Dunaliella salina]|uniref:Polycystin cation channel PKD1/PKD2 domain-containing protein n=1 Tax=Dunaliella salina TaxID=3046 RepID=A0ABQ7GKZ1_DUNSA|nr:hypothetical protein DUNSADRAFT_7638 [Dunaliella salina]|eukprot:KAF5835276.1 hypothetical protein DUNSADRAFT_7638 [Dunaliella salina]
MPWSPWLLFSLQSALLDFAVGTPPPPYPPPPPSDPPPSPPLRSPLPSPSSSPPSLPPPSYPSPPPSLEDKVPPSLIPRQPWQSEKYVPDPMETSSTIKAVVTSITVLGGGNGAQWTDPGCAASDAVDGDISNRVVSQLVQSSGELVSQTGAGASVQVPDAHRPTASDTPWLVRYMVQDAAGNAPKAKLREVHITCPEGEKMCEEENDGSAKRSCSVEGICLDDAMPGLSSGDDNKERTNPSLSLLGGVYIQVPVDGKYERCDIDGAGSPCDRGVNATDTVEGNILSSVLFSCRFRPARGTQETSSPPTTHLYSISEMSACGFSTSAPGTWSITYQVSNNEGMSSEPRTVERIVSVAQVCLAGEIACEDGTCASDSFSCPLTGNINSKTTGSKEPKISLKRVPGTQSASEIVSVEKGTSYQACNPSSSSSLPSGVCEPGAEALDAAGEDITHLVLSCPGSCLEGPEPSCSSGHQYTSKGIQGCEIDTLNGEVGMLYELRFAVISPSSGLVAQTTRLIEVVSPCPEGQNSCSGTCVQVSCDVYNQINSGGGSAGRPSVDFFSYSRQQREQQEKQKQGAVHQPDVEKGPYVQQIPALPRQEEGTPQEVPPQEQPSQEQPPQEQPPQAQPPQEQPPQEQPPQEEPPQEQPPQAQPPQPPQEQPPQPSHERPPQPPQAQPPQEEPPQPPQQQPPREEPHQAQPPQPPQEQPPQLPQEQPPQLPQEQPPQPPRPPQEQPPQAQPPQPPQAQPPQPPQEKPPQPQPPQPPQPSPEQSPQSPQEQPPQPLLEQPPQEQPPQPPQEDTSGEESTQEEPAPEENPQQPTQEQPPQPPQKDLPQEDTSEEEPTQEEPQEPSEEENPQHENPQEKPTQEEPPGPPQVEHSQEDDCQEDNRQEEGKSDQRRLLQTGFENEILDGLQLRLPQQASLSPTQQQHTLQRLDEESGIQRSYQQLLATTHELPASGMQGRQQEAMSSMQDAFLPSPLGTLSVAHQGRSLLQEGSSGDDPVIANLETVSPDLAWSNPRLAPCRSSEKDCGVRASDSLGNDVSQAIRVVDITPCSAASKSMEWLDWVQIIQSAPTPTEESSTANNVFVRIEAGAAHALNVTLALNCREGAAKLQEQVSDLGVDVALPYLQALGLELTNLRQVVLLDEPKVLLQGDKNSTVHPGIAAVDMPPLCLAQVELGLQVGCTPEVKGYQSGPGEGETVESWCPCSVEWNKSYRDNPLKLDSESTYTIVDDLYGPLISFSLGFPLNSTASSPVPHCAPLTKPLNITEVQVKQVGAHLSMMENVSSTVLADMEALAINTQSIQDLHDQTDSNIEEKFRAMMDGFLNSCVVSLDGQLQATLSLLRASRVGLYTNVQSLASSMTDLQKATEAIGQVIAPAPAPTQSEVERAIAQCVSKKRGGAETSFFFKVPFQDQEESASPTSRKLQSLTYKVDSSNQEYFGRVRVAGLRGNQILSGAFLHQERRPLASLLPGGSRYSQLCQPGGLAQLLTAEKTPQCLTRGLQQSPGSITTQAALIWPPRVSPMPLRFSRCQTSLPLGYPVVLDINLEHVDGERMMEFLKIGNYLNRLSTTSLLAVFPSYNRDTQLYGHTTMRAHWTDSGRIEAQFSLEALEFRDYSNAGLQAEGMRSRLATDMVLLLFILVYCMLTAKDVAKSFAAQQRRARMLLELHHNMQEEMRAHLDNAELQSFHIRLKPTYKPRKKRQSSSLAVPPPAAQVQTISDSAGRQLQLGARASPELPFADGSGGEEGVFKKAPNQGHGRQQGEGSRSKLSGHSQMASNKSTIPSARSVCELEPSDSEQSQQYKDCRRAAQQDDQHHHCDSSSSSAMSITNHVAVGESNDDLLPLHPGLQSTCSTPFLVQGYRVPVLPHLIQLIDPSQGHFQLSHEPLNPQQHHPHQQQQQQQLNDQEQQEQQLQGQTWPHPPAPQSSPVLCSPLSSREQSLPPSSHCHSHPPLLESMCASSNPATSTRLLSHSPSAANHRHHHQQQQQQQQQQPPSVAQSLSAGLFTVDQPSSSHISPRVSFNTGPSLQRHCAAGEDSTPKVPKRIRPSASASLIAAAPRPVPTSPFTSKSGPIAHNHSRQADLRIGSMQKCWIVPRMSLPEHHLADGWGGQNRLEAAGIQHLSSRQIAAAMRQLPAQGGGTFLEREGEEAEARSGSESSWAPHPHTLSEERPNDARVTHSRGSKRGTTKDQETLDEGHLFQTTETEADVDWVCGGAMRSAGLLDKSGSAAPVAEATEKDHAAAAKHTSSCAGLSQGHCTLSDAMLESEQGESFFGRRGGWLSQGLTGSQVSKEGSENDLPTSAKECNVCAKDGAFKADGGGQKWHDSSPSVGERKASQAGLARMYRGAMTPFWMGYEMLLCFLMISAMVLLLYAAMYLQPVQAPVERRFDVYDSLNAPAHPLLLRRKAVPDQSNSPDDSPIPGPGDPYRWQIAYSLLQGGVLLLLMARLLSQVSFQPQWSVIAGTFAAALEDIIHFIIIICVLAAMFGSALHIVFGADFNEFMTPGDAMYTVFSGITSEADAQHAVKRTQFFLEKGSSSPNVARRALAWFFIVVKPLIFKFMMVLVMSIIAWPYAGFSMGAREFSNFSYRTGEGPLPPKLGHAVPDKRLLLYPTPAAAVPSFQSSPYGSSLESSKELMLELPGSKEDVHPAAVYGTKGCAHRRTATSSPLSSSGSSDFLDSDSEDAAPAAHMLAQESHAAQPTIPVSNPSNKIQSMLQQLSQKLKAWHQRDPLLFPRAHALTVTTPLYECHSEPFTYDSLCTLTRASAPMSWGPSSEQELAQLLSLALMLQKRSKIPSSEPHVSPQQLHEVDTSQEESGQRGAHGGADDGGSDGSTDESGNSSESGSSRCYETHSLDASARPIPVTTRGEHHGSNQAGPAGPSSTAGHTGPPADEHTDPLASGWLKGLGAGDRSIWVRSKAISPAAPAPGPAPPAAAKRARHCMQHNITRHFGRNHTHKSAAPQQQELQAAAARPTEHLSSKSFRQLLRFSSEFERENESKSDIDQDVAAGRAVLQAEAQRGRLKQMLSGKMGQELFGQEGAVILPAKIPRGGGKAGHGRQLQWQASKQKALPALPSLQAQPVSSFFHGESAVPRPLASIAAGITGLMEHNIMLIDQLRSHHLQVQSSIKSAQATLDKLRADHDTARAAAAAKAAAEAAATAEAAAATRVGSQRGWTQATGGILGMARMRLMGGAAAKDREATAAREEAERAAKAAADAAAAAVEAANSTRAVAQRDWRQAAGGVLGMARMRLMGGTAARDREATAAAEEAERASAGAAAAAKVGAQRGWQQAAGAVIGTNRLWQAPQPPPAGEALPLDSNQAPGRAQMLRALRRRQLLSALTQHEGPPPQPHADIEAEMPRVLNNSKSKMRQLRRQHPAMQWVSEEESTQDREWGPRRARTRNRQAAMQRVWKTGLLGSRERERRGGGGGGCNIDMW